MNLFHAYQMQTKTQRSDTTSVLQEKTTLTTVLSLNKPGFFLAIFFKTQGRQNSMFFKTQAIFLQNSRKIS